MDNLSHEQKLRITIYSEVRKICLEAANKTNQNLDKEALDLIAELVWKKLRTLSQDLEHFAKHSKRTTVTAEDVKLSLRRLPTL
ncbi:unnamed protein product, partial [Timema podura]|nr:unnamed protein product [Timema podura]